jgi:hypothetical protein
MWDQTGFGYVGFDRGPIRAVSERNRGAINA